MKALVVDDDLALADVVSFTLRRGGYEVVAAHDGLTALERWESESPDISIPALARANTGMIKKLVNG